MSTRLNEIITKGTKGLVIRSYIIPFYNMCRILANFKILMEVSFIKEINYLGRQSLFFNLLFHCTLLINKRFFSAPEKHYKRGRYNSGYDSPSVWKFLFSKYFGQL